MANEDNNKSCLINEQGDLGLWCTPLSESDQEKYDKMSDIITEDKKDKE